MAMMIIHPLQYEEAVRIAAEAMNPGAGYEPADAFCVKYARIAVKATLHTLGIQVEG
jgi:hypothetical protein